MNNPPPSTRSRKSKSPRVEKLPSVLPLLGIFRNLQESQLLGVSTRVFSLDCLQGFLAEYFQNSFALGSFPPCLTSQGLVLKTRNVDFVIFRSHRNAFD